MAMAASTSMALLCLILFASAAAVTHRPMKSHSSKQHPETSAPTALAHRSAAASKSTPSGQMFLSCKDARITLKVDCSDGAALAFTKDAGCGKRDCTAGDFGDFSKACCTTAPPNLHHEDTRVTFLLDAKGRVPKAVYKEDPEGSNPPTWKGLGSVPVGLMADVFTKFAEDANVHTIPTVLSAEAIEYAPTHKWNSCIRDIELNNTDVCVGSFTVTSTRSAHTLFAPAVWEKEMYLMAKPLNIEETGSVSLRDSLYKTFDPFKWQLWLVTFGITMLTALLYVALEYEPEGNIEFGVNDDATDGDGIPNWLEATWDSIYQTFQGFFGGAVTANPETDAGRMLVLGYGFFVLIVICHYTAELTVAHIPKENSFPYNDMTHLIKEGGRICVDAKVSGLMSKLKQVYPLLIEDVNMFGFLGPLAKSFAYNAGECEAIVDEAGNAKFNAPPYCGFVPVGVKIYSNLRSMPVRTLKLAEAFSHFIMIYAMDGTMDDIKSRYTPHSECTVNHDDDEEEESGLRVRDLMGAIFLYFVFALVAILSRLIFWTLRSKSVDKAAISKEEEESQKVV